VGESLGVLIANGKLWGQAMDGGRFMLEGRERVGGEATGC